jgi:protein ImuB
VFAVVYIPNFALQSLLRHEPELRERPVALIDGAGNKLAKTLVLECTHAAEMAGVGPGLTAPQAQARCRELVLKPRSLSAEQRATEILLQTAYAFSPNIENTALGVCTIDLRGLNFGREDGFHSQIAQISQMGKQSCSEKSASSADQLEFFENAEPPAPRRSHEAEHLPIETWSAAILTSLRSLGIEAQIGIAATPNLALLAARAAKTVLVIERVETFFRGLPIAALEPSPQVLDIVKRWGIHTTGAFLALGKEAIAERLGAEALELFHRAGTQTIRPLNIVLPPDTFEEQMDFEARIETIEPLLFVLRRFVEQLSTRIAATYRVVAELHLKLSLESGLAYERTFKIPAPTANIETLFGMLHTHLESLRTDSPVQSLRLGATPVRAEGQQFGLFESALRDPNHFHETLARLTALLGLERVGTPFAGATHQPDVIQMRAPAFGDNQSQIANSQTQKPKTEIRNSSGLCLRRFRPPIHAEVELKNGEPAFLSTLVVSGRVKRARGPWCISGTWWDQRRWSRQEWDVETEKGEVYRVRNADGDWLVEGVYD